MIIHSNLYFLYSRLAINNGKHICKDMLDIWLYNIHTFTVHRTYQIHKKNLHSFTNMFASIFF